MEWKLQKQNPGAIGGEHRGRAALACSVCTAGGGWAWCATRGFPTPPRAALTAAVGVGEAGVGGGGSGSHPAGRPGLWRSRFLRWLAQRVKDRGRTSPSPGGGGARTWKEKPASTWGPIPSRFRRLGPRLRAPASPVRNRTFPDHHVSGGSRTAMTSCEHSNDRPAGFSRTSRAMLDPGEGSGIFYLFIFF